MPKLFNNKIIILILIFIIAAFFRFYSLNWDSGFHMHPDERAIAITVDKLKFPNSFSEFISPQSSWNPHFFAYGSMPMYLLRFAGDFMKIFNPMYGEYASINLVGRAISAFADLLTVFVIYKLAKKLFNEKIALLASFLYAVSVLPIQLSHFYAVDTILTLFITTTLYSLILFYEKPSLVRALIVGIFLGAALATKISAIVLGASIVITLTVDLFLIFLKSPHKPKYYLPHIPKAILHLVKYFFAIGVFAVAAFIILEPYALIDFKSFWEQNLMQSLLTKDPFYFPYTLQFVGKVPYVYELKNLFFWGLGPVISTFAFLGTIYTFLVLVNKDKTTQFAKELILFIFFIVYFGIVGRFAVGFMRYMMPLYPMLAIFAAVFTYKLIQQIKNDYIRLASYFLLLASCLIWPLSFMKIYSKPNTRISASEWIYKNIPANKTLAVEHWDDQLPIGRATNYQIQTLKLYDSDNDLKWNEINTQLSKTDYIIVASNRLYVPLQKLTDCMHLPTFKCYERTAEYYKKLFSGELGFQKVSEFTSYPTIPVLKIPINDQLADENFTVFDHPKVMIFQKVSLNSKM